MAVPMTEILWDDESDINAISSTSESTVDYPVGMFMFTADKGPEEWKQKVTTKFLSLYGSSPSFAVHGQPLLQAAAYVAAGGRATCKRVVAEDATLANIGVVATVKKISVQKSDSNGNPIYTDGSAETTNPVGTTPVMIQKCQIGYELRNVNLAGNNVAVLGNAFLSSAKHTGVLGEDDSYPLFIIADNGRGVSNKKFRIAADSTQSRPVDYVKYILTMSENGTDLEHQAFCLNPDRAENEINLSLENVVSKYATQYRCKMFESEIKAFIANVAYLSGIAESEFKNADIIFGNNLYGNAYSSIVIDTTVDLSNSNGISLIGGSNGLFGDSPISASTYATEMVKAINGDFTDDIYDLDNFRIDAIFDANYPAVIKRAIEDLVTFREDCEYFRDMGLNLTTMDLIKLADAANLRNRYCCTYHNSWDIYDPYTYKQITVTATYGMCVKFVQHFINGVARPFCGIPFTITWSTDEVVEGSVNFTPKKTPVVDQKQWFDDNRINYASYHDGTLTMETQYTTNVKYTQLSFIHNVLAIQSIIRDVRAYCPRNRYAFSDGDDLTNYQKGVNNVLDKHTAGFKLLKMVYAKDVNYENNKIYFAYIYCVFRDYFQRELFKICVLKNTTDISL